MQPKIQEVLLSIENLSKIKLKLRDDIMEYLLSKTNNDISELKIYNLIFEHNKQLYHPQMPFECHNSNIITHFSGDNLEDDFPEIKELNQDIENKFGVCFAREDKYLCLCGSDRFHVRFDTMEVAHLFTCTECGNVINDTLDDIIFRIDDKHKD